MKHACAAQRWLTLCVYVCVSQVEFERPVDAKGNIEVWLQRLVDGMQDTVKQCTRRAVRNVAEMALDDFIFNNPAQVSLLMACVCMHPCALQVPSALLCDALSDE